MKKYEEFSVKFEELVKKVRGNKEIENKIMKFMITNHNILLGQVIEMLDNPSEVMNYINDEREVIILIKQLQYFAGDDVLDLEEYFDRADINETGSYDASLFTSDKVLPMALEEARQMTHDSFDVIVDIKDIKAVYESQILTYDFDIQREYTVTKDRSGKVRKVPTLYRKNVNEISELLLKNELKPTTLIWNANKGSADGGTELIYDPKTAKLEILKGTKLAILDGYHRINGIMKALTINPDLSLRMPVTITNYRKSEAQEFQRQISKATPISRHRQIQLSNDSLAIEVIKFLEESNSDMKDKIGISEAGMSNSFTFVQYEALKNEIDANFTIRTNRDAKNIGEYLVEFYNELINLYVDDFLINLSKSRRKRLVTSPKFVAGYISLAAEMMENGVEISELKTLLAGVNFEKTNPLWKEIGILTEDDEISTKINAFENLKTYLKELIYK